MAISKDVVLSVIANVADYQKKMAEIPGVTEKQAAAAAKKWGDIQTKAMAQSVSKSKKASEEAGKNLTAVDKIIQGLGYQTNDIKDLAEGIGMLGGGAGVAGTAALGASIAFAALGAAAVTAVAGVVSLVAAGDDLAARLDYLKGAEGIEFISDAELDTVKSANAAMTALADTAAQVALEFAVEFAPAVEAVFFELTRLGIAAVKFSDDMTESIDVVRRFAKKGIEYLITGMLYAIPVVGQLAFAFDALTGKIGGNDSVVSDYAKSWTESAMAMGDAAIASIGLANITGVTDAEVQSRIDSAKKKLYEKKDATKAAEDATRALADAERELAQITEDAADSGLSDREKLEKSAAERIKRVQELYAVTKDLAAAERALAAVRGELALGLAQIQQKENELARKSEAANAKEAAEQAKKGIAAVSAAAKAASQEMQKIQDANSAAIQGIVNDSISLVTTITGAISSSMAEAFRKLDEKREELTAAYMDDIERIESARMDAMAESDTATMKALDAQRQQKEREYRAELQRIEREKEAKKRAALAVYAIEKALALTSIAIQTAVNIVKAGGNPIEIAAVVASGIAQAAAVLAVPPPSFHVGGMVKAPDEQTIRAKAGEFVLSTTGVRAAGGEDNLRRLNRGESMGAQPMVVQMVYSHRVFESFVSDNLKMGGALGQAVRAGRYTGRNTARYRKAI